jgi:hypothetical protein
MSKFNMKKFSESASTHEEMLEDERRPLKEPTGNLDKIRRLRRLPKISLRRFEMEKQMQCGTIPLKLS